MRIEIGAEVQIANRTGVPSLGWCNGYTEDGNKMLVCLFVSRRMEWVSTKRVTVR